MPRFDYLGKKPGTKADPEYPAAGPPAQSPNRTPGLTPPLPHRRPTYRPAQSDGVTQVGMASDELVILFAGCGVPDPHFVGSPRIERITIWRETQTTDDSLPFAYLFARFRVPKVKRTLRSGAGERFSVRSKDRGYPRALITLELMSYLASGDIPKTNNLVVSTRCDGATIGRKRDGIGFTGTSETTKLFAGRGLPETNRAIFARRCHQSPHPGRRPSRESDLDGLW